MEQGKVSSTEGLTGMLEARLSVVEAMIAYHDAEWRKDPGNDYALGLKVGYGMEQVALRDVLASVKPVKPEVLLLSLAYEVSVHDEAAWERIKRLLDRRCACGATVACEDEWRPGAGEDAEYCGDCLAEIYADDAADRAFEIRRAS